MHRTCREKLFESSPTSPSRTFERGRRRQRSVWGQVLSQIKITLCNRRRGGPCGGAEGDGSEDLHTEYGVKSLSKPRRGGGRGHYLNVRVILIADNGYKYWTKMIFVRPRETDCAAHVTPRENLVSPTVPPQRKFHVRTVHCTKVLITQAASPSQLHHSSHSSAAPPSFCKWQPARPTRHPCPLFLDLELHAGCTTH